MRTPPPPFCGNPPSWVRGRVWWSEDLAVLLTYLAARAKADQAITKSIYLWPLILQQQFWEATELSVCLDLDWHLFLWISTHGQWTMDNGQWTMDNGQWTWKHHHFHHKSSSSSSSRNITTCSTPEWKKVVLLLCHDLVKFHWICNGFAWIFSLFLILQWKFLFESRYRLIIVYVLVSWLFMVVFVLISCYCLFIISRRIIRIGLSLSD